MSGIALEQEQWVLDRLAGRELDLGQLLEKVAVVPYEGDWQHELGGLCSETGERGMKVWSRQTIYQACERLRMRGKIDRRRERGRGDSGHALNVYFRVTASDGQDPLEQQFALPSASESGS